MCYSAPRRHPDNTHMRLSDQSHPSVPMNQCVCVCVCDTVGVCSSLLCQQRSRRGQQTGQTVGGEQRRRKGKEAPGEEQKERAEAEVNVALTETRSYWYFISLDLGFDPRRMQRQAHCYDTAATQTTHTHTHTHTHEGMLLLLLSLSAKLRPRPSRGLKNKITAVQSSLARTHTRVYTPKHHFRPFSLTEKGSGVELARPQSSRRR